MTIRFWPAVRHNTQSKTHRHLPRLVDTLYASGKYIALGVLFLLFLLLGQEMVQHRYSEGGWVNRHGTVRP